MGILSSRFGAQAGASEVDSWLTRHFSRNTYAGKHIDEKNALFSSPVFACIKILAEDLAKLPCGVYEEQKSGFKARAKEHPANWFIQHEANPHMSAYVFKEALQGHVASWGNAYAEIQRRGDNGIEALWPLLPDRTAPKLRRDKLVYETKVDGQTFTIPAEDMIHVPGLGFDGYVGYSIIHMARQAISLGMAAEEFGARWFGQGSQGGMLATHPGKLTKDGRDNLREYLEEEHAGLENSHRIRVLTEGISLNRIGIPPDEAQFHQTRVFQISEVARFIRMQLHKLQELTRSTNNNIEWQGMEHVVDTMMPWFVRWEQELNRKLFVGEERGRFYVKFNVNALMRGDSKARGEYYTKACGGPFMAVNEVRELEELPPVEGGDEIRSPVNMAGLSDQENDFESDSTQSTDAAAPIAETHIHNWIPAPAGPTAVRGSTWRDDKGNLHFKSEPDAV